MPWWGWVGLGVILAAEFLVNLRVAWVSTFFTPIVWSGYILLADGLVTSLGTESWLSGDASQFLALALCSIPLWTLFELYNLRLENWTYVGIPDSNAQQILGYAWAFATIWPAIYETADLVEALGFFEIPAAPCPPSKPGTRRLIAVAGFILVAIPVTVPQAIGSYLFGAVWVGFALLLDPITYHWRGASLLRDWERGTRARLYSLLAAGWICGILWEFWNYWAGARWVYTFPMAQSWKIFEMPMPGYFGFPAFAVECWVMYEFLRTLKRRLGDLGEPAAVSVAKDPPAKRVKPRSHGTRMRREYSNSKGSSVVASSRLNMTRHWSRDRLFLLILFLPALTVPLRAQALPASSDRELLEIARGGMNLLLNGDPDAAIQRFQEIRRIDPDSPLGYLFEADAYWWKIYLTTGNLVDPDVFDVVSKNTSPYDSTFQSFAWTAVHKAEVRLQVKQEVARNLLYQGMTYGLLARYYGLRDNDLPTARAGKKMRALLLEALKLDPSLTDAYLGLGIYNYFVDTLPTIVKMLRFLIGLPGGDRELGIQQMEKVARQGDLARGEAKFYLAKDYSRRSEQQYAKSLELFQELSTEYPMNLLWKLVIGSLQIRLGHAQEGEAAYREVLAASAGGRSEAEAAIHSQTQQALNRMHPGP